MAKKDLRAQMDAARAAAAFIDAAHDELESSREMRGEGADEAAGADDGERSEAASRNRGEIDRRGFWRTVCDDCIVRRHGTVCCYGTVCCRRAFKT